METILQRAREAYPDAANVVWENFVDVLASVVWENFNEDAEFAFGVMMNQGIACEGDGRPEMVLNEFASVTHHHFKV